MTLSQARYFSHTPQQAPREQGCTLLKLFWKIATILCMNPIEQPPVPPRSPLLRWTTYLPYLAIPLCLIVVYSYDLFLQSSSQGRAGGLDRYGVMLEIVAPWILMVVTGLYWGKAIYTRNLTYVILAAMVGCLLLRELHWDHAIKTAIFPLLGICLVWFILWRDVVDSPLENFGHTRFFVPALAVYAVGQLFEKRLFRFLPDEEILHTPFEESFEVAAHTLLLLAVLFGSWARRPLLTKPQASAEESA